MDVLFSYSLLATILSLPSAAPGPAPARGGSVRTCRTPLEADPAAAARPLRPLQGWIRELILEARTRSITLDSLIRAAESSGALIYVDEAERHDGWDGRTVFAAASGGYSYLRIELHRLGPNRTAALLAHELQHVMEIVSSDVATTADVERLYQRIGMESRGFRERRFETNAAIVAGRETLLEMNRGSARTPAMMASD